MELALGSAVMRTFCINGRTLLPVAAGEPLSVSLPGRFEKFPKSLERVPLVFPWVAWLEPTAGGAGAALEVPCSKLPVPSESSRDWPEETPGAIWLDGVSALAPARPRKISLNILAACWALA